LAGGIHAFAKALRPLVGMPPLWVIFLGFIIVLAIINFRGIKECVWVNMVCTAVEAGGLLFVIAVSIPYLGSVIYLEVPPAAAAAGGLSLPLVMTGAVLTFYAFVGFEDLLNLSEEVKDPQRTMPWGIILAVGITTILYILVSVAAVSVVAYADLAHAPAPLAAITQIAAPWLPPLTFTGITLFAVANTALMNFIMGSRLVYGMAKQGLLPSWLGKVHSGRQTPHRSILILALIVAVLAFAGDISALASATSLLLLLVFGLMNAALIVLKIRRKEDRGHFEVPMVVPIIGFFICMALVGTRLSSGGAEGWKAPAIAVTLLAGIGILYFVVRPSTEKTVAEI
jgi:amino acid transporter